VEKGFYGSAAGTARERGPVIRKRARRFILPRFLVRGNGKLKIKMPSKVKKINLVSGGKGKGIKWILRSYCREQSANKGC